VTIDSHQHFWRYSAGEYPWMTEPLAALRRDYLPADLAPERARTSVDASIAVQARQSLEESRWLLGLAENDPSIAGVVGWVDLQDERVAGQLAPLAAQRKFVGVRHVVQDEPEDNFMLRPAFLRGIGRLREFGLTYDLLTFPRQLRAAIAVVRRFPEQPFVLDHLGKPFIKRGELSPWREEFRELARSPNVMCKLSGMVTEADWRAWKPEDFRPYLDEAWSAFGEDRLMFGSDWPVCTLAGNYAQGHALVADFLTQFAEPARAKVMGANASRFYGLK
jgi:L-fuconolactonase